jgi:DNA-binding beta-propeller fold protein YncE
MQRMLINWTRGMPMRTVWVLCATAILVTSVRPALGGSARDERAFTFDKTMVIPGVPWGPYSDHLAVDVRGDRLFATPQAAHEVAVLDIKTSSVTTVIKDIGNPHGVFYSEAFNRLFVTDGAAGNVKVFDGTKLTLETTIPAPGADGLAYDPSTKLLYAVYGGDDAGMKHASLAIIDTATSRKVGDIAVDALSLDGSVIDPARHRLYVEMSDRNAVAVVDLIARRVIANWSIGQSRHNMATALDLQHHLLYVGCRDGDMRGSIAVLELSTGRVVKRLPIGGWVDSMDYDARRHRIYLSSGTGYLEAYQVLPGGAFRKLEPAETAVMAKTSLYSPQLDRDFVSVPHLGDTPAKILVFAPVDRSHPTASAR